MAQQQQPRRPRQRRTLAERVQREDAIIERLRERVRRAVERRENLLIEARDEAQAKLDAVEQFAAAPPPQARREA